MSEPFIDAEAISKTYRIGKIDVEALRGLSFSAREGDFIAVTGSSGSGKSTLLNLLGGLDRPTAGSIRVAGRDLHSLSRSEMASFRRNVVGMIFQSFNLLPARTALENVELPMIFSEVKSGERHRRAFALLERVGLSQRSSHRPAELSGGEQQRVAIARSLANTPRLLLADEPTGNLDSVNAREILRILADLNRDTKITVILVTHENEYAREFAGEVFRLQDGKLFSREVVK